MSEHRKHRTDYLEHGREADGTYVVADHDVAALCEFCARAHNVPRA